MLTEGRRAFLRRVSGIQRGADCARYEPILSALADGEASAEDLAVLRPHMRTCLSCRAALREFRAMPKHVASVVPPAALATADDATGGPLRNLIESVVGAAQHKTAAMGERLQAAADLATGQKVAAVAASAAALAGGGTALHEVSDHKRPSARAVQTEEVAKERAGEAPADPVPPVLPPSTPPDETPSAPNEPVAAPGPEPEPPAPPPDPADEFEPTGAPPSASPSPAPSGPAQDDGFVAAGGGGGTGSAAGSGEFAP